MSLSPEKPRVLLAIDRHGWAFHHIAEQLCARLGDEYDFTIVPYQRVSSGSYEVVVAFWWNSAALLRANLRHRSTVLCLYDHYSWASAESRRKLLQQCERAAVVAVASEHLAAALAFERVEVCEDGVDTAMFTPADRAPNELFTVGWAGNSRCAISSIVDPKGVELIRAACAKIGARFVTADRVDALIPHAEMPAFYRGLDCYVCASVAEGTPNPLLESLACGVPVISTDVGIARKVIKDGASGYLVERRVDAIAAALAKVRNAGHGAMSRAARDAAETFDWGQKIGAWRKAIRLATERPDRLDGAAEKTQTAPSAPVDESTQRGLAAACRRPGRPAQFRGPGYPVKT